MSILTQGLPRFCRRALEVLLPNSCLLCGLDSEAILCPSCFGDLPRLSADRCPRCAEPTQGSEICGSCLRQPRHFDATTALYRYEFPVDQLIHVFKYEGRLALGHWFARQLAEALAGHGYDRIIPMPLHPVRLAERGFNQSGEIARTLGRLLHVPLDQGSCHRTRANLPQAGLPLGERVANVRGIFECTADLSGLRILLVDDVMTSGATLDECSRILKIHGASHIGIAVVARALRN